MEPGGKSGTWVTWAGLRPEALHVRRFRLIVVAGPDAGQTHEFERDLVRVGARGSAELQLTDPRVSGLHLELRGDELGYRLRDLGSKNGTFVDGLRILDAYVESGALVRLGDTQLRFDTLDEAAVVPLAPGEQYGRLHGRSPAMRRLFALLPRLAAADTTVLVSGETGTGKELVAEALHTESARAGGPLEVLDCGALPQHLVESELFGHERGAFTGAHAAHAGVFERASGGTVFLDEIGELPLSLQPKLLRVLEAREVRRLGGSKSIAVDVRVVAATNRDLALEVERGRFREDLYYRLAVVEVRVPPLRERAGDVALLIERFLAELGGARIAPDTLSAMLAHDWPGNVRELRNAIERAGLGLDDAPLDARHASPPAGPPPARAPGTPGEIHFPVDLGVPFKQAKHALIEDFEQRYVGTLLARHKWNFSAAAREAGVDRMALHKIVARCGLEPPDR